MTLLLAAIVDLSVILAVGLAAALLMRRRSAALRHGILAAAVVAGAAVPALELLLPPWPIPLAAAFGTAPAEVTSTLRLTTEAAPLTVAGESTAFPAAVPVSWPAIAVIAWLTGAFFGLTGLATGLIRLVRITARCEPVRGGPWRETADRLSAAMHLPHVTILQSDNPSLLVTWGLLAPKIILPAGAADWSEPRRRIVLAHEMAHIGRRDWLVHMCAETLRACYWVNPLAWAACRRLRQESEYACDDAVLSGGVDATDYASHLLAVARQAIGGRGALVSAPAIAHPSTLERRIAAMLTEKRNREPLTRRASLAAISGIAMVALPITALTVSGASTPAAPTRDVVLVAQIASAPVAALANTPIPVAVPPSRRTFVTAAAAAGQQTPATLSVLVQDPSGAVLPGVEGALDNVDAGVRHRLVTDATGRFSVTDLPPGRYQMVLSLPGFATVTNVMPVTAGLDVRRTITLPLGSLEETILVTCGTPAAATPASPPAVVVDRAAGVAYVNGERYERHPNALAAYASVQSAAVRRLYTAVALQDQAAPGTAVRVGGQIAAPRQIRRANPVCPRTVLPAPDTVVVLTARVGVDGYLNDLREVTPAAGAPAPAPEFVDAALDAVRQWGYTPTRLNNVPVEAGIRITVRFSR